MSLGNDNYGFFSSVTGDTDNDGMSGFNSLRDENQAHTVFFRVNQCVEGGWETEVSDGRFVETDTNFSYNVVLEFESAEALKNFHARDDLGDIVNTMDATVRSMLQDTLQLEMERDYISESYSDGVVPDDVTRSFADTTLMDLNDYDMKEFTHIMQQTYPDIGLVGAGVDNGGVMQLPGCFQGIDDNIAGKNVDVDSQPETNQGSPYLAMKL